MVHPIAEASFRAIFSAGLNWLALSPMYNAFKRNHPVFFFPRLRANALRASSLRATNEMPLVVNRELNGDYAVANTALWKLDVDRSHSFMHQAAS